MSDKIFTILLIVSVAAVIVVRGAVFVVPEGQQVIVTQLGKPVGEPITEAGLKFKLPFIQDVRILEKRMLNWDGRPTEMTTRDKKTITVDTTARWLISDPLLFLKSVQNERNAISRIDDILEGETRKVISNNNLVESVRNSNAIFNTRAETVLDKDDISGEILKITKGREKLSGIISKEASNGLKSLGIKLIDVQIRRIAYESTAEAAVYKRMVSERERVASKLRSEGRGEATRIRGLAEKELQEIESEAYRRAQKVKGDADGTAIKIYADAIKQNPEFYEFSKTLDTYRKGIKDNSKFILSSKSKFFKLLQEGPQP